MLSKSFSSADGSTDTVGSEIVHGVREGVQEFIEKQNKAKKMQSQKAKAIE